MMFRAMGLFFALSLVSGCATVVKGTTQVIPINSDPTGAEVLVNNNMLGITPTEIKLKRKNDHQVIIRKEGYSTVTMPVLKSVGGAVWGNVLAGGLIGWGVDATSGAQYNLSPETIFVTLRPAGQSSRRGKTDPASEGIRELKSLDQALEAGTLSEEEYGKARRRVIEQYFPEMLNQP
jgi:hypothetical protein